MTPDYGVAVSRWRDAAGQAWTDYTRHAFVAGLGDGTMPETCFLHYLRQDWIFLKHFSRAWALAAVKADTIAEIRAATATLNALINEEMRLHVEICAAAGISQADLEATTEAPENMAYTRFVLEAGFSGDFLNLLAALAPCVHGYGDIGLHLKSTRTSDRYAEWIDTYAGDDYQAVCVEAGQLIDTALANRLGPDWPSLPCASALADTFASATRLEVGFWDMGLRAP
ncbi:thiaminase II [Amaricoccus tamworthensis]|uniref:thiaminase II n=1 Tax=Amaricoccus tamworthensis TaxID=57002 RepID=UPI003C7DD700